VDAIFVGFNMPFSGGLGKKRAPGPAIPSEGMVASICKKQEGIMSKYQTVTPMEGENPQHFLFLRLDFVMGGIETLILRMAKRLRGDGHNVTILTQSFPEGEMVLPDGVNLIVVKHFRYLMLPLYARWFARKHLGEITAITCYDRLALCIASLISRYGKKNPGVVCMAYSPWEMKPSNAGQFRKNTIFEFPTILYDKVLPDSQKAFMSPPVRSSHESVYQRQFEGSIIFPIPIFEMRSEFECGKRQFEPGRIVSVGRLCDEMKQYNLSLLPEIRKLVDVGNHVRWDIYGHGKLYGAMQEKIKELDLQDVVFLHGNLDYEKFADTVSSAQVFVGMGTAALEAAILGVPTVIAHAATWQNTSHGFLQDQPFGIVGEIVNELPTCNIIDVIKEALLADTDAYALLSRKSREASEKYTFEVFMPDFYAFACVAKPLISDRAKHYRHALASKILFRLKMWPPGDDDFLNPHV
jgi:glycosyltransferase involved in cell wall biosynthesis